METKNHEWRRQEPDTERGHVHIDRSSLPSGVASSVATRASVMPAVNVYIPTPFRKLTGNRQHVHAEGRDVDEVLANVEKQFPGFRGLVFGSGGEVPAHINIYVNKQEINSLQGIHTKVAEGDEVAVIPAMAGGADNGATEGRKRIGALTAEQVNRYSRHIIMPQVGPAGQRKI